ncbi:flagellar hook-associated protein FlgK [Kushneria phosphatilytica]|uniref:Flagellar hook-associated protein 1 n=1 Tax=Kushneria phosphatilytica TaxID=657387 RepID=A0A1S1NX22_9GAMM|nr:flagellar hook-associated protein FlgK [Kushneria phosphatilytica]OHV12018.1 flagellar hook-associated protein FlgK [Kushneria phosphatilytica]QEL11210.1 flagellar hook-associated protein FlgK [Kushneria phosphatilytica]
MSSSLFGIGLSGLRASQIALNTTSNNISNVDTEGYNRQITQLSQNTGSSAGGSFSGNGVTVTGVERQYQQYLNNQLNSAQSTQSALSANLSQATQIDNLLADNEAGINTQMQQFFAGLQTVADNPSDTAARQSLLGNAESMTAQFNSTGQYFDNLDKSVESQMGTAVEQINGYASQLAKLNDQISQTTAKTGMPPNGLMDQRDAIVTNLNRLTDVSVVNQEGQFNVSLPGGQPLVIGDKANSLSLISSKDDPDRKTIGFNTPTGQTLELNEQQFSKGTLGGLIGFRNDVLEPASHRLDQLAQTLGSRINALNKQGEVLGSNQAGEALFSTADPVVRTSTDNEGSGSLTAEFALDADGNFNASAIRPSNYQVEADGSGNFTVTRLSDGKTVTPDADGAYDGLSITLSGGAAAGDTFTIKPLEGAASNMQLLASDPADIAARSPGEGSGGNSNALKMAALQDEKVVNGNASFNSAYAQIVSSVGNQVATLSSKSDAQGQVVQELQSAQQSVSGVNLDEEAANLVRYQQLYTANAQVIRTASGLFDTLLGIMS